MRGTSSRSPRGRAYRFAGTAALLATLFCTTMPATHAGTSAQRLTVERVVVVMRHGVRPPTKEPAMPAGVAAEAWPSWSVPPGWLTEHGAEAVRLLGKADRTMFADEGVLPRAGCPQADSIALFSDSDQRTIATGDSWAGGLAPGCAIENRHRPQQVSDPLFEAIDKDQAFDAVAADKAVRADLGAGGVAGLERRERRALEAIDRILCGAQRRNCGVLSKPSSLAATQAGKKPKLDGALDAGSTAAQILLLEYAEGKPMQDVGWGRASAADVALVGSLHSAEFAITARTRYVAERSYRPLVDRLRVALSEGAPKITMFVGHDTTVASLAGRLGLHWKIPGFAADDPAPGGALIFEAVRDGEGRRFVRVSYRSQTLDQIRNLSDALPVRQDLVMGSCTPRPTALCSRMSFERLLADPR